MSRPPRGERTLRSNGSSEDVRTVRSAADARALVAGAQREGVQIVTGRSGYHAPTTSGLIRARVRPDTRLEVRRDAGHVLVPAGVSIDAVLRATRNAGSAVPFPRFYSGPALDYFLEAGVGPVARQLGVGTRAVQSVSLVTADGELVRTSETHEPDLFWAVRGGGGGFGIVLDAEVRLSPSIRSTQVVHRWRSIDPRLVVESWLGCTADENEMVSLGLWARRASTTGAARVRSEIVVHEFRSSPPGLAEALVAASVGRLAHLGPTRVHVATADFAALRRHRPRPPLETTTIGGSSRTITVAAQALADGSIAAFYAERLGAEAGQASETPAAVDHFDAPYLVRVRSVDASQVSDAAVPFHVGWAADASGNEVRDVAVVRDFFDREGIFTPDLDLYRSPGFVGPLL